jgi:hypothetical protein
MVYPETAEGVGYRDFLALFVVDQRAPLMSTE